MANEQRNTTDNEDHGSPFARPAFIGAAVLVLIIVLLGVVLAVRVARSDDTVTPPPISTALQTTSESASSPAADPVASVCGLPATTASGPLTAPPAVTWTYQGTIAYPKSPEFGPGKTAPEGYRYCFQRSPAGALVMAANATAQGSDPQLGTTWSKYVLAQGPYREELEGKAGTATGAEGTRLKLAGFRVLDYTDTNARVDLAFQVSAQNQTLLLSAVYELVWQDGDWKMSADVQRPLDTATIPDLTGYTPWGE